MSLCTWPRAVCHVTGYAAVRCSLSPGLQTQLSCAADILHAAPESVCSRHHVTCSSLVLLHFPIRSKIEEAVSKARAGHYQLACASAFEGIHRVPEMDVGISAPLQYYSGTACRRPVLHYSIWTGMLATCVATRVHQHAVHV